MTLDMWPEVVVGMLGPLAAAGTTWIVTQRTIRRHPERLTAMMVKLFAGKMVFFGVYVIIALNVLLFRATPFVLSFTGSFIAVLFIEAVCLSRLFAASFVESGFSRTKTPG